jgi:hypothetical protein
MSDDIMTRLRVFALEGVDVCDWTRLSWDIQEAADEIQRLSDERDKWQLMAADLAEHLENALYSDEWKTREYAIVAFGMFERELPHWRKGRNPESDF